MYYLLHDQSSARHQPGLLQRLAEVDRALERLPREIHDEPGNGYAVLRLQQLRHLEQRRLGRQGLHDVSSGGLQAQASFVMRCSRSCSSRCWCWCWGGGRRGRRDGSTLPRRLRLLRLAPPLLLVRLDLRLDPPLRLEIVQLLLALLRGFLDLLLPRYLFL